MAFFFSSKPKGLLAVEQCNPGRAAANPEAAPLDATHFVKGNRLHPPFPPHLEVVTFGFGCFWCSEGVLTDVAGVWSTSAGYSGGVTQNPSYRDICKGDTNHNEVVRVVFDPATLSFGELLRVFWSSHDPTTPMRQGNDRGTQYRSGIYCSSEAQRALAEASKVAYAAALGKAGRSSQISTEIVFPAPHYWIAEVAHQQYDSKPGSRDYCGLSPLGVACPPVETFSKV